MTTILVALATGLASSFIGSFLCFVIWVHFDFDERWRARKELNRLRDIQHGRELENEQRILRGLPPLDTTPRVR